MNHETMSERLFTLANGVTVLAIVLSLLFVCATTRDNLHDYLTSQDVASLIMFVGLFVTAACSLAVWFCYLLAYHDHGTAAAWFFTSLGRTITIVVFGLVVIGFGDMHRASPVLNYGWLPGAPTPPARVAPPADETSEDEAAADAAAPDQSDQVRFEVEAEADPAAADEPVDRSWRTD